MARLLLFLTLCVAGFHSFAQTERKYTIKSCKVIFSFGATAKTEKKVLYIQDYGNKERWEIYDYQNQVAEIQIHNNDHYYKLFMVDGDSTYYEISKEESDIPPPLIIQSDRTVEVAGKTCVFTPSDPAQTDGYSFWHASWNNIYVMNCIPDYGAIYMRAISIEEKEIPEDLFLVPKSFKKKEVVKNTKYDCPSGVITYDVQLYGKDQKQYKEKWVYSFTNYGNVQCVDRYKTGQSTPYYTEILDYKGLFRIYVPEKKYNTRYTGTFYRFERLDSLILFMDFKRLPKEVIATKTCDVYQSATVKQAAWKYICLFWQEKQGSRISYMKATSVKEETVPKEKFTVPEGFVFDNEYGLADGEY